MRSRAGRGIRPLSAAQVLALAPTAWWKADALSLSDGAPVDSWPDSSGNGWTLTQTTALKQPLFDIDGLNGKPSIKGSATNVTALVTAVMPAMSDPYTVIVVGKAPTVTPSATQYLTGGNSSGNRRDIYYTSGRVFGIQGSAGNTGSVTAPVDTPFIVTGVFNGASSRIRHDSINLAGSSGNTGTALPVQIFVGARNGGTASFDGWISEVLFFSGRLSDVKILQVERHLSLKWGIPLTPMGVTYVNGDTGSDTLNTGRSSLSPFKSPSKAHSVLGSADGRIEVSGTLRDPLIMSGSQGGRLFRMTNAQWYGSERHTSGWTSVGDGVYSKSVTGYDTSVSHARIVNLIDSDGYWTTLRPANVSTAPESGEIGYSSGTLYVRLPDNVNPNTMIIEVPRHSSVLFSSMPAEVVIRSDSTSKFLCANRGNITAGSAGTDGKIVAHDVKSWYGGDGGFVTQNDATSFHRYRCESRRAMNDGGNWHGSPGRPVLAYSEDCDDAYNFDEGESAHDSVVHVVRGGRKHHNVSGGGITNVGSTTLDANGSNTGPLVCDFNRTGASAAVNQGGVSIYSAETSGAIGESVVCRDNNGAGIYIHPDSANSSVHPIALAMATGNTQPNTVPS